MPFIPWDVRDPVTGEFPAFLPYADEINSALPIICPAYNDLEEWQRNAYADLVPGGGGAISRLLTGRNLWDVVCEPFGGAPPAVPANAQVPTFPQNCATQGFTRSYTNVSNNPAAPNWILGETFWDCDDNIGIPTGQPVWTFLGGSTWGYVIPFLRADGTGTTTVGAGSTVFGDVRERVSIETIAINYCPSCNLPDPPPVPPTIPEVGETPQRPVINLPITIPQPPGLPPINLEIPYSPTIDIGLDASVQPVLTLSPNVEIAPGFEFAPTFEFNVGGVSIGGGGYAEPREDAAELQDCDCPDPCPPPGDTVDYQRIQNSLVSVISQRWRLPGVDRDVSLGAFSAFQEAGRIELASDAIAIQIQLDLTSYVGGGTPTINGVQGIGYYGWFTWTAVSGGTTGSERHFLSSNGGFIEVPPFATALTFYCQNGALARVRQATIGDIPVA